MASSSLLDALGADRVLSVAQLERHFGMTEAEACAMGARGFVVSLSKTKGSTRHTCHRFIIRKGKRPPGDGPSVRHLTGTAEMRYLLGASADVWVSDASRRYAKNKPDAIWRTPEGVVAIEYDAGAYDPDQIREKLIAFEKGYVGQIWGSPSKARVEHIKDLARNVVPDLEVLYAPWF